MLRKLSRTLRPSNPAVVTALSCAILALTIVAGAAAPDVASPAAWTELEFRVLESNDSRTLVEVLFPAPEMRSVDVDGRTFNAIRVPGASPLGRPGEPLLCVAGTMIAIPPASGVEMRILEEGHDVLQGITPLPYRQDDWTSDQPLLMDEAAYSKQGFSLVQAEVGEPAIMRDFRVVPLRVFPLSYDASTRELRVTRRLLVELDYSSAGRINVKTSERAPSRAFRAIYENSIANYDFVKPRYESDSAGTYLIITHNNFYSSILPLAEWKHKRGMEVEIANTAIIGTSTSAIKSYIQTAYDTWTVPPEYVLLVGDSEYIPTSNMDNYYGQLEGGDILVDVHVGRLPADNVTECDLLVAKTLGYKKTPYMSDLDWFRSGCLIVRQDYDADDAIYFADTWFAWGLMDREGFAQIDTFFSRNGTDEGDVHAAITDGRVFLNYRGQGVANWWSPYACNPALTNPGYKLPVVMAATCGGGNFTYDGYPCENWLKSGTIAAPRGSVASIGTSVVASGVAHLRSVVNQGFYGAIFNLKMYTLGEATTNGKLNLYNLYPSQTGEYNGWNCQGDPELDVWTKIPRYADITHPPSVPTGSSNLSVHVEYEGADVQEVLVCAYAPGEVYENAYTNVVGDVSLSINVAAAETVWVTVTGHNLHPYEGYAVVA
ncbi:MAG: C25 family cysteine peptidase, partial [Candidatus Eisenbacteria bacterium]